MRPENHPFSAITPDFILNTIESRGFRVDARILELNSYENRVFQIGIENGEPIIAKFYRPDRWSQNQVQEEHDFLLELASNEIAVVAPIRIEGTTQFKAGKFIVALFKRRGGRTPLIESESSREILGRTLSQI
ncbi:MAG: phosphotransferase, partial [Pseudomonadota bacterium]|nr:phosphotransferase [Pseudomonadota bacterium]